MTAVHSPEPVDRPVDHPWATRAELLAARAEAVPRLEARLLSLRRIAAQFLLLLVVAISGPFAGVAIEDPSSDPVSAAVTGSIGGLAALAGAAASISVVRGAWEERRLWRQLLAWEAAERVGRALPRGPLRPELRMPFDAQADEDFDAVVAATGTAAAVRWMSGRVQLVAFPGALGCALGVPGVALVFLPPVDLPAAAAGVSGAVVLLTSLFSMSWAMAGTIRLSRISSRLDRDVAALPRYVPPPRASFARRVVVPAVLSAPFTVLLIHLLASRS